MIYLATLLYMLVTYYTNRTFLMCYKNEADDMEVYTDEYIQKHKWNILRYKNYM